MGLGKYFDMNNIFVDLLTKICYLMYTFDYNYCLSYSNSVVAYTGLVYHNITHVLIATRVVCVACF